MTLTSTVVAHRLNDNRLPESVYYRGAGRIDAFRGVPETSHAPEDWVGSVTAIPAGMLFDDGRDDWGLSRLATGELLRDAIQREPQDWLGDVLAHAFGDEPRLLVKLLDAGQRLPVHFHPDAHFARRRLNERNGKNEGWIVMAAEPGARMWLGFQEEVEVDAVMQWVQAQDTDAMLGVMNERVAKPGDAIYVPAGVPHAFGPGLLICELQEPSVFSVLLEHEPFGVDADAATLGLGWKVALEALDRSAWLAERLDELWATPWGGVRNEEGEWQHLFPEAGCRYFDARRVRVDGRLTLERPSFAILVVTHGEGTLQVGNQQAAIGAGQTWVVPYAAGVPAFAGRLEALICLPPVVEGGVSSTRGDAGALR